MKHKKEYSKILATIILIIFIVVLIYSLLFMTYLVMSESANVYDFAIVTSALTITGGLLGATCKYYYNKSGLQNVALIRNDTYKEIMKVRLEYDKEILDLKKVYGVDDNTIDEIENEAPFKSMSENAIGQTVSSLDSSDASNSAEIDVTI